MNIDTVCAVLLIVVVMTVLAVAGIGLWMVRQRRKAWDEYVKAREAIDKGTKL